MENEHEHNKNALESTYYDGKVINNWYFGGSFNNFRESTIRLRLPSKNSIKIHIIIKKRIKIIKSHHITRKLIKV